MPQPAPVRTPPPPLEPIAAAPISMRAPCRQLSAPPRLAHHMNPSPGGQQQLQPSRQLPLTSRQWQQPMPPTAATASAMAIATSRAGPSWACGGNSVASQPQHTLRSLSAGMSKVSNAVPPMVCQGQSPARTQPLLQPALQCTAGMVVTVSQATSQQASASSITAVCEPAVVVAPPSPRSVQEQRQQQQQPQLATRSTGTNARLLGIRRCTSARASCGSRRKRVFSAERVVGASVQVGSNGVIGAVGGSGDPIDERWLQVCSEVAIMRQELDKLSTACRDYRNNV